MLIKRILAYFKARKEQMEHDRRPLYYPNDGTVEERRAKMVTERVHKYQEACKLYHGNDEARVDTYLNELWNRVEDAKKIVTYEDWEEEQMKEDLPLPHIKIQHTKTSKHTIG